MVNDESNLMQRSEKQIADIWELLKTENFFEPLRCLLQKKEAPLRMLPKQTNYTNLILKFSFMPLSALCAKSFCFPAAKI